ncbi:hypothetical protein CMQ_4356 [Grosmannia clavigera kw1407]|uniref:MARVEL domain-containing protein n=1 Tax=Grosmannia clavigera (strain kw1407 / UAMH 11150) TaxID=655863 RepID=F0XTR9_GROCL|nr:uncharacterized protein CMQ_4356 [Grosmannia clavigera kw1407]EFW98504.1 hypothetical protein CMQ_4356 [Grosmannia clavigera kw1407]
MKINWLLILRVLQCAFSIIILGLSAYVVNWYNTDILTKSPTQVNFLVAAPIISILSIAYAEIASRFVKQIYNPYVAIACDFVNAILYFAGFIALAVFLSGLFFCRGTVCAAARADTAFAAFSWAAWIASTVLTGVDIFRTRANSPTTRTRVEMKQAATSQA